MTTEYSDNNQTTEFYKNETVIVEYDGMPMQGRVGYRLNDITVLQYTTDGEQIAVSYDPDAQEPLSNWARETLFSTGGRTGHVNQVAHSKFRIDSVCTDETMLVHLDLDKVERHE